MQSTVNVDEIYLKAFELPHGAQRAAFLDRACDGNSSLRRRVERYLEAQLELGDFLESPAPAIDLPLDADAADSALVTEIVGAMIGPYKLREQIGEGGMGLVFVAEQTEPVRRQVALKVCKPGMDTREVLARFAAERQALALMDHPNIARVLDAGTTDSGRPYFVMELVRGVLITEYCQRAKCTTTERLELFVTVCQAVQHAHLKGIIHRDIKPSNVMVTLHDGVPVPKVIDFGVAKALNQRLTEQSIYTQYQQLIGTPLYMSPEQAEFSGLDVDTRTDVYSLGVLLYELLTGTTPFDSQSLRENGLDEFRRVLREQEPPRPSARISTLDAAAQSTLALQRGIDTRQLSHSLKGEVDWIVMQALEKDRNRRYESVNAFAADVQRYLDDEPVQACPPSAMYRLRKTARRHKGLVTTAALLTAVILFSLGLLWNERNQTLASLAREYQEREKAEQQEQIARQEKQQAKASEAEATRERETALQNQYFAEIVSGQTDWKRRYLHRLHQKLIGHLPLEGYQDLRGWEWYYLFSLCHPELHTSYFPGLLPFATWSPDGEYIAASGGIWRARSREMVHRIAPSRIRRYRGAWSPGGRMYAWATADDDSCVYVWNSECDELRELRGHKLSVWDVDWSPDGMQLASGGMDTTVRIWDVATGSTIRTLDAGNYITNVAWSPDGDLLAAGVRDGGIKIWQPETGEPVVEKAVDLPGTDGILNGVIGCQISWHPSGDPLAVCMPDFWYLVSRSNWNVDRQQAHEAERGTDISWSPDGQRLAVADGAVVSIWDPAAPQPERVLRGHLRPVTAVDWSPNGQGLVSSARDGSVKVWDLKSLPQPPVMSTHASVASISWLPDNDHLRVVSAQDGSTSLWNASNGQQVNMCLALTDHKSQPSPDGRFVAVYPRDAPPEVQVFNVENGSLHAVWRGDAGESVSLLSWSGDGSRLAIAYTGHNQSSVDLWDVDHERLISTWIHDSVFTNSNGVVSHDTPDAIAWSPDNQRVAVAARGELGDNGTPFWQGHVYVVEVATGATALKHNLGGWQHRATIRDLAWNPDGDTVIAGSEDGLIEAVGVTTGRILYSDQLRSTRVNSVAWHPDGTRIASASRDGIIKVMAADAGEDLLVFELDDEAEHIVWSPDGRRLAGYCQWRSAHMGCVAGVRVLK